MSVETELTALSTYISNAYDKISEKGGTVPQNKNMENLTSAIDSITSGGHIVIPPSAGTLVSISVTSNPTKTVYNEGDYFDFSGLVITAYYSSGNQYDVTTSCTYIMNEPLQYGDSIINVSYETQSTTISIVVNALPIPAPLSCIGLYHFNNSLVNEATENSGTSLENHYGIGKFGNAIQLRSQFNSETFSLSTSNSFTIEFWIKASSNYDFISYDGSICYLYSNGYFQMFPANANATNGLYLDESSNGVALNHTIDSGIPNFSVKNWNHIALVVTNDTYSLFVNGIKNSHGNLKNKTYSKFVNSYTGQMAYSYETLIDELMICDSAKYSSNFTPPNAPYYIQ